MFYYFFQNLFCISHHICCKHIVVHRSSALFLVQQAPFQPRGLKRKSQNEIISKFKLKLNELEVQRTELEVEVYIKSKVYLKNVLQRDFSSKTSN